MSMRIAASFLDFCHSLDRLRYGLEGSSVFNHELACTLRLCHAPKLASPVEGESYLCTLLQNWVQGYVVGTKQTRTDRLHQTMNRQGRDGRRTLPSTISIALSGRRGKKVEVKWVVCYLAGIRPAETRADGVDLECSHRCINQGRDPLRLDSINEECIDPSCLCWETKSQNQSRGNWFCCKPCSHSHCSRTVCECQGLHIPPCL